MSQIGEYEARGPQRGSRAGTWQTLSGSDGQLRGGLRLDKVPLDQGIADRLSEAVRAVRAINLPGLNTLIDQVHDGNHLWLISNVPPNPTVSSLTNLPAPVAALIAVDIGQTLASLHSAGLAHGDVSTDTAIVTVEGRAVLIECGYAHALAGTTPGPGHDVNGWVGLVRFLAAASNNNELLLSAASQAEGIGGSAGLSAALASLATAAPKVPGYGERSALAVLATIAPSAAPVVPVAPVTPSTPESVTVRLMPAADSADATMSPAELETALGKRNEEVLRFGRGVAAARPPQQASTAPPWQGSTASYPVAQRPNRARRRLISIFTGLITVVILAVVGYFIIQRLAPLQVTSVAVGIAQPLPANACDTRVDVVGTVTSNGNGGSFTYRWLRSDGASTAILSESVPFGTSVTQVHLFWQFSGKGTLKAKATLQILTPQPVETSTEFTYTCR
ncbi:hypothetical protein Rhe02_68170 [Rhizocola hellebori]|uniref:Uncharacterized protein n=1 Tax=Rhizocola hellebori TaxID=1392758 RepID=A0A8J3QFL5_9ACTN|nr:hypothetical protein [Rhizocola hellebori]GIH08750.1 hypothetical protein Rhe02_68170 [Rhizocola hellebori]